VEEAKAEDPAAADVAGSSGSAEEAKTLQRVDSMPVTDAKQAGASVVDNTDLSVSGCARARPPRSQERLASAKPAPPTCTALPCPLTCAARSHPARTCARTRHPALHGSPAHPRPLQHAQESEAEQFWAPEEVVEEEEKLRRQREQLEADAAQVRAPATARAPGGAPALPRSAPPRLAPPAKPPAPTPSVGRAHARPCLGPARPGQHPPAAPPLPSRRRPPPGEACPHASA
jgi:hypothetical protein